MNFLISVIADSDELATGAEMASIDVFNDRLVADGHWVFACGLASPAFSTVIDSRSGVPVVAEGPLSAADEFVAGFWIVDAPDRATAQALATEGSRACNRKVELRALLG